MSGEAPFDPSLLPRNPWEFFRLQEEAGEKDLRRAYFAAVRIFRPETHPGEFQRIREAYEILLETLREGGPPPLPLPESDPASRAATATPEERDRTARSIAENPATPGDFLLLALLADVEAEPRGSFGTWLLRGLARHPGDRGLTELFRALLEAEVPPDRLPGILISASRKIPESPYWQATEPAWEIAAVTLPFEEFRGLWEQVESRDDGIDEAPRARTMCRVLPHLAPRAPRSFIEPWEEWVHGRRQLLPGAEEVLDVLESCRALQGLRERATRREEAASGGLFPRRRKVQEAPLPAFPGGTAGRAVQELVQAVFSARAPGGEARLRGAARKVVGLRAGILREFAPSDRGLANALSSLPRVAFLLARHQLPSTAEMERFEEAKLVRTVHGNAELALSRGGVLLRRFLRWTSWLLPSPKFLLYYGTVTVLVFLTMVGFTLLGMGIRVPVFFLAGMVLLVACIAGFFLLMPRLEEPGIRSPEQKRDDGRRVLYRRHVRSIAVHAVAELGLSPAALVDENCIKADAGNPILALGVAEDPALPVLWAAHRFAR